MSSQSENVVHVKNREALANMQSKKKMLDTSILAWTNHIKDLESKLGNLEADVRAQKELLDVRDGELQLAKKKAAEESKILDELESKYKELELRKTKKMALESKMRSVWNLKRSEKLLDKQYTYKKEKLEHMERNIRSVEGGIRMFEGELKAISELSAEERRTLAKPSEIAALQKRVLRLHEKRKSLVKERDAYARKVQAVLVKVGDVSKARAQAMDGMEELGGEESWANQNDKGLNDEMRRVASALSSAKRKKNSSNDAIVRSSVALETIRKAYSKAAHKFEELHKWRKEARERLSTIGNAHVVLNNRIQRLVNVTSPPISPGGTQKPRVIGYPCTIPVQCTEMKKDLEVGVVTSTKCEGNATLTAFLLMFENSKANLEGQPAGKKNSKFCVDMEDIEKVEWGKEGEERKDNSLTVTLKTGHTNRFRSPVKNCDPSEVAMTKKKLRTKQRVMEITTLKEEDNGYLKEFFNLLELALLLHQATAAALPEGYSIFPKSESSQSADSVGSKASGPPKRKGGILSGLFSSRSSSSSRKNSIKKGESQGGKEEQKTKKELPPDISLMGTSKICSEETLKRVISKTPSNLHIEDWKMFYSLENGANLQKMYLSVKGIRDTILLIQDSNRLVYGFFNSSYYTVEENYYGNGMSFVFKVETKEDDEKSRGLNALKELRNVEKFAWKGTNELFVLCKRASLAFGGGGDGGNALRLDKNFCSGFSEKCSTYGSPMLSKKEEFKVYKVEVWAPAPL